MENKFTPEMLEKCKEAVTAAKSAEEILEFAKQNNIEMTAENAAELFARHHKSGELSDEELDNVSGGGCGADESLARVAFRPGTRVRVVTGEYAGKCGAIESYNLDIRSFYDSVGVLNICLDDGMTIRRTHECFHKKSDFKITDFGVEKI